MAWIIDADTHVDESEATWRELQGSLAKYVPVTVTPPAESLPEGAIDPARSRWWFVEGRLQARAIRDNVHHPHRDKRELKDVPGRLEDMDRMDVRAQVIFPTFFIRYNTANPEAEQALTKAYNRWIAERCAASGGRLHWAAMLPLLDADESVKELRWAKDHGACGFFKRGYDLDRQVSDPHFFPVYEEAASLDLPVCIHTGHPLPGHEWDRGFPVMAAFTAVVTAKLPERFPKLRFGFIEAGASWIPYTIAQLETQQRSHRLHERTASLDLTKDLFRTNRLFVALDPVDDIEYLLTFGTEDNLIIGTDYCHSDPSANLAALGEVQKWADEGKITQAAARKILEANAQELYGF